MATFYYYYSLPDGLNDLIDLLVLSYNQEGMLSSKFIYSSSHNSSTLFINKNSLESKDRLIESLVNLGFGTVVYEEKTSVSGGAKDQGYFTLSKEMIDYYQYKEMPNYRKWLYKQIDKIKENDIPITLLFSFSALVISIFALFF